MDSVEVSTAQSPMVQKVTNWPSST